MKVIGIRGVRTSERWLFLAKFTRSSRQISLRELYGVRLRADLARDKSSPSHLQNITGRIAPELR
jgi:hypothetical protein